MRRVYAVVALLLLAGSLPATGEDAVEIIRKAFEASERNEELTRSYTFHERMEEKLFNRKGKVRHHESKTWDVTLLEGSAYRRLIAKDDEPLGEKAEAREARELRKSIEERRNETPKQRQKRLRKVEEEREERMKFIREITRAFDFRMWGEEAIDGIEAWVIYAQPRPDYEPAFRQAGALKKIHGRLWISKQDYGWMKADIDTIDGFSWGLFLLKIHKGAKIQFSQQWVNDEVWLMDNWHVKMSGRAGLIAGFNGEFRGDYSNFRKFSSDSSITFGDSVE